MSFATKFQPLLGLKSPHYSLPYMVASVCTTCFAAVSLRSVCLCWPVMLVHVLMMALPLCPVPLWIVMGPTPISPWGLPLIQQNNLYFFAEVLLICPLPVSVSTSQLLSLPTPPVIYPQYLLSLCLIYPKCSQYYSHPCVCRPHKNLMHTHPSIPYSFLKLFLPTQLVFPLVFSQSKR